MKTRNLIFTSGLIFSMTLALLSCAKVQSPEPSPESPAENQEQSGKIEMEFSAISEAGTKTALGELSEGLRPITWVKDDEIKIYFNESFTTSKALSDGATTTFKANVDEAPAYYAVYPSSVESSLTDGSVSVTIPAKPVASKDFGSIHYAAAIAKDGNLSFKNLCGFIRFEIRNPEIRSLIIRGAGEQLLAGKVSVSFDENGNIGIPSISGGNSRIIATVAGAGVYYIPVLPGINLENGVGFRFYKEGENAIETGVFSLTPLSVSRSGIVDLGCIDERIVTDWYIAPIAQGTGDGLSAENAAAGVTFLRRLLAQDDTNDKTKDGLAKGYGCIGVKVHAAAGEYDFGEEEIVVAWPGHTSAVGTTIEGAPGTLFKNSGNSRFFKLGVRAALTFNNLRFTGGKADKGGALYLDGDDATIKCDGCVFDGNLGSAVYLNNASASAWFNSCVFTGNNSTPNSDSQYIGRAVFTKAGAATFFNNCTFGEQVAPQASQAYFFGDIEIRSGELIFANSTMIGSASGGIFRVHTGGGNALYLNSLVINKSGAKAAINYNSTNGTFISSYVISGPPQNKYKPSDTDIAKVKYADIGSPAFDETDLVYKWDGKLTGYDKRISATDAAELIKTSSPEFHSWLNSINALDKDQLGNPRSPNNRQGSWCGN